MHTHKYFYTLESDRVRLYDMTPAEVFGPDYKAGAFTQLSTCFTPY